MGPRQGDSVGRSGTSTCAATKRRARAQHGAAWDVYNSSTIASFASDDFAALRALRGWRGALLGTAAAGAIFLAAPEAQASPGPCITVGTTVTCTGDQSAGITGTADFNPATVDTLNVNSLTTHIMPALNVPGIYFRRIGVGDTITINSAVSPFSITTNGGDGINADAPGAVSITHTGDVNATNATAISAYSATGPVTTTTAGNLVAAGPGIRALAPLGNITITHTGDVTSTADRGFYAISLTGTVSITSTGRTTANGDAIDARGVYGTTVVHTGDIASTTGRGIYAYAPVGIVSITSIARITSAGHGIDARGYYGVTILHTGNVTSTAGRGISASALNGPINITSTGNFTAVGDAIYAYNCGCNGGITIVHTGDLASTAGRGIAAYSASGAVSSTSIGAITSFDHGIQAQGPTGVTIVHTGNITSTGGAAIFATAVTGNVNITTIGNLNAPAQNGIIAVSAFGGVTIVHTGDLIAGDAAIRINAGANVNITLAGGTTRGGVYGIRIPGAGPTTITILPTAALTAPNAAIYSNGVTNMVYNHGVVTGDVRLGGAVNAFFNRAGGVFNPGADVNLNGGLLQNDGTLAPFGIGAVGATGMTGTFVQNAGGRFAVDVNMTGGTADGFFMTGPAVLNGLVVPKLLTLGAPATFTILTAAGGTINAGIGVQDTAVVNYELVFPNANDLQLQIVSINFVPLALGLTPNQEATAQNLQSTFLVGGGNLAGLLNYLAGLDAGAYQDALDHLHPEPYLAGVQTAFWAGLNFGNSLLSCPQPAESGLALMKEGSCLWLRAEGHSTSVSARAGFMGFSEHGGGLAGGFQREVWRNIHVSAAFGYERSHIDIDTRAKADGNLFHGGVALKYIEGNLLAAVSLGGGFARYETKRFNVPPALTTASAHADTGIFNARFRVAYTIGSPFVYAKPMIDFDVTGLFRGAINESGAGASNLNVRRQTDWIVSAAPALELAAQWQDGDYVFRPFVRAGLRIFGRRELTARATFEGSPAGVSPFTVTTPLDQIMAEVSAGADVWKSGRFSLRIAYDGRFGAHTHRNGGQMKLRAAF